MRNQQPSVPPLPSDIVYPFDVIIDGGEARGGNDFDNGGNVEVTGGKPPTPGKRRRW